MQKENDFLYTNWFLGKYCQDMILTAYNFIKSSFIVEDLRIDIDEFLGQEKIIKFTFNNKDLMIKVGSNLPCISAHQLFLQIHLGEDKAGYYKHSANIYSKEDLINFLLEYKIQTKQEIRMLRRNSTNKGGKPKLNSNFQPIEENY